MPGMGVLLFGGLLGPWFELLLGRFRRRGEGERADVRGVRGSVGIGSYGVERREFAVEPFGLHGGRAGRLDPLLHDDLLVGGEYIRHGHRTGGTQPGQSGCLGGEEAGRRGVECLGQDGTAVGEPQPLGVADLAAAHRGEPFGGHAEQASDPVCGGGGGHAGSGSWGRRVSRWRNASRTASRRPSAAASHMRRQRWKLSTPP
jgi:hypothetical protein